VNGPDTGVCKIIEETARQIQAALWAILTLVRNLGSGGHTVVGYLYFLETVVGVVPLRHIDRDDIIAVGVGYTTSSKSSVIESEDIRAGVGVVGGCSFGVGMVDRNVLGGIDSRERK